MVIEKGTEYDSFSHDEPAKPRTVMAKPFYILSIDGGGFRGAYSAHLMTRMEQEFAIDWRQAFNLIAGTSTGAIIAAGLATGLKAQDILDLYKEKGRYIFKKRLLRGFGLVRSRYRNKNLKAVLDEKFAEQKLGDISVPLILPATDIGNGCVHVFKSMYHPSFVRDRDVLVSDAVLASCSAPTYFDPHQVSTYLLADGGLWSNSPALVAAIDAKYRLGQDLGDLRILSIGTGGCRTYYSQRRTLFKRLQGWGFAARWGRSKFIDMLFNLQAETANNMLGLLLNRDQILRINFTSDSSIALDDPAELGNLISVADRDFTHNAEKIRAFLNDTPGGGTC